MKREGKEFHLVVRHVALGPGELISAWKRSGSQVGCRLVGITVVSGNLR